MSDDLRVMSSVQKSRPLNIMLTSMIVVPLLLSLHDYNIDSARFRNANDP
jgi:hypothetical protein